QTCSTPSSASIRRAILRWNPWSSTTRTLSSPTFSACPIASPPMRRCHCSVYHRRNTPVTAGGSGRGGDQVALRRARGGQDLLGVAAVAGERTALLQPARVVGVREHQVAVLEHVDHLACDVLAQRRAAPAAAEAAHRRDRRRIHVVGAV